MFDVLIDLFDIHKNDNNLMDQQNEHLHFYLYIYFYLFIRKTKKDQQNKYSSYIEHFLHDHIFVFHDYIEIVLDNKLQNQYHDNNHDKLSNHMDHVHAMIYLEDILSMI